MTVRLDRRAVVRDILSNRPANLLVVTGLGSATYDVAAAGDDARNFYLWGAMGGAVPVGLGLALSRPDERVLVITGDGEMLMGLGALASAGVKACENLAVCVIDNEAYGETGGQASHTGLKTDLAAVALAAGFAAAWQVTTPEDAAALRNKLLSKAGPLLANVKVAIADLPRVLPSRDGQFLRTRFRSALGFLP